ncbi:exportin-7-like protein [Basidiobolus meristosporus CBS 931.73]|uniref:Exportin-7-like protein n=1 Tax=Basidiobolus meristosporus CBS 931.73 TaxID=1314790 RepID=A0A1Y1ZBK9_9FUNG|nr:exportin-7-like protein [Basidiobolus meristosporus CBS 931.73]|eukprot:ORY07504.1 exportin-7-like protein [Basidiobolus meristosporus CBS 931.73]
MNGAPNIETLETLCEQFYNPRSNEERSNAEKMLAYYFPTFSETTNVPGAAHSSATHVQNPIECAMQCHLLLESSSSPYAQMFASYRLRTLVTDHFSIFNDQQKIDERNFVLNYLGQHPDLMPFVVSSLGQLFSVITKLGWFESEEFKNLNEDISKFLQASAQHRIIGLQLLGLLITEINQLTASRSVAKHRKIAVNFRDGELLKIFQTACGILRDLLRDETQFNKDTSSQTGKMKEACLNIIKNALAFDFIGTCPDESSDDSGSIQIPSTWRSMFEDPTLVKTLFDCYKYFQPPHSSLVMEILVQVASIRRSLFNEEERAKFVVLLMDGIRDIINTSQGMDDQSNYHEFCRMLARFRSTYHLNEVSEGYDYASWIEAVAGFTVKAFHSWQWAPNSLPYLLSFWSKMASSLSIVKSSFLPKLEDTTAHLAGEFISSRMDSVGPIIESDGIIDDPLDNEEILIDSLEMLTNVARCKYEKSCEALIRIFDFTASSYQGAIQSAGNGVYDENSILVAESKLAWLVYLIGSFIGGRTAYQSTEEQDTIDGNLASKVLQLMEINQVWLNQKGESAGNAKLELAYLHFFYQFRKSYIGEQSYRTPKVYVKLAENFGLNDQTMVLDVIVRKLGTNLKYWGNNSRIISKTLNLFNELASGYSSVRLLQNLDTAKFILRNHTSEHFPFLLVPENFSLRLIYYMALSKLFFSDDVSEEEFMEFIKPFENILEELKTVVNIGAYKQDHVKAALNGLLRDLRGFITPIQSRRNYLLFFDWFFPNYMPVLLQALEAWKEDRLAITILKFMAELGHNKSQRLNFDISSANGILLFRETSKMLCTFGAGVINRNPSESNKYTEKYKGISVCFDMLSRSLTGRYVSFGVFALYGDKALELALNTVFEMMLSIPVEDLMVYPKLCKAYFTMIDVFSNEHMTALPDMDSRVFWYIIRSLGEGLKSSESSISSFACSAVDHLCTFVIKLSNKKNQSHWLLQYFNQFSDILPFLFTTVFNLVLFDEKPNQWSLSRPLLGLILLNREYMMEYTGNLVHCQLVERRELLAKALQSLMEEVDNTLSSKNRDRFTQNLGTFRREITAANLILVSPSEQGFSAPMLE